MVWVFSLEWLQLVFGTSLSLVIIALNSHHIYHTLWFFFSQCVQSLMCQENTSLIWNDMNLCGIPHVLVLAAQTQVYQLARSKSKLSLNWGLYTKLVLNCDLQLLPHMGVLTFQLYFFTWPLWTMFSGKFQIQPQKKKIFQCWLIQAVQGIPCHSDITSEELELGRYFLRCLSVRLFGRAGGCGEPRLSDTKMAQYWKGWRGKGQAPAHHRLCFGCTSAVRHERSALHLSWAELTDVPGWHCQASQ